MSKPFVIGSAEWLVRIREEGIPDLPPVPIPWVKRSRTKVPSKVRGNGEHCSYCKRQMVAFTSTHPTKDHVVPKSKGGRTKVWACTFCNNLKKDMMPDDWTAFMESYPEWWAHPQFQKIGGAFAEKKAPEPNRIAVTGRVIPRVDSQMILKHGKDFWRAWKNGGPCCGCCRNGAVTYTPEGWPIVPRC